MRFRLPLDPPRLLRARQRIRDYLHEQDLDTDTVDDVVLAIEEAMTNAVRHSCSPDELEVVLRFLGADLHCRVKDHGVGFDVSTFDPQRVPGPLDLGGRGLYLIASLMEKMELRREGGLQVRMIKRNVVPGRAAKPLPAHETPRPQLARSSYHETRQWALLDEIDEALVAFDWEYRFVYLNQVAERIMGRSRDDLIGRVGTALFPQLIGEWVTPACREAMELGKASVVESASPTVGCWIELRAYPTASGINVYFRDIDERKQKELERDELAREQEITVDFLRLATECRSTRDLVHRATAFLHELSGCEALGMRVRHGDDYPYLATQGFPPDFVAAESRLCDRDERGRPVLDARGDPQLACMCGVVIAARHDDAMPFFTTKGTFWTNSTTELLAATTPAERRARTRNCCNTAGYESVMLVPLAVGDERLGLIQLNDSRAGLFTPRQVALFERLADSLAVALAKFRADDALRENMQRLRFHLENTPLAVVEWDHDFIVTRWAGEAERVFGWSEAETLGVPLAGLNIVFEDDKAAVADVMARLSDGNSGQVISANRNYTKDGRVIDCVWYNSPLLDADGRMVSVVSLVLDKTEPPHDDARPCGLRPRAQ